MSLCDPHSPCSLCPGAAALAFHVGKLQAFYPGEQRSLQGRPKARFLVQVPPSLRSEGLRGAQRADRSDSSALSSVSHQHPTDIGVAFPL